MNLGALSAEQQRMVLDAAVKLAATQELATISLDQLTKISGVSAFEIIRQYQSKENILKAVLERELELIAGSVPAPELRFPGETIKDELQVLAKIMLQEYRARLPFLGKILNEAARNPEVGALFYRTFVQQGRLLFAEFLSVRKKLGELREDLDAEVSAAMFLSALTFILLVMELYGGQQVEPLDDERLVREMSDLFIRGAKA